MISNTDRILVLVPHPDDEVLGTGGVIQTALAKNIPIKLVFFTYGDANELSAIKYEKYKILYSKIVSDLGTKRYNEAIQASNFLGLSKDQIEFLGYPDFGTLTIWNKRWRKTSPYRGLFTRKRKVPYKTAYRYKAPYKAEEILQDLKSIIKEFQPTQVYTSHRHDYNTDHQALYLFTRVALWELQQTPSIFPFLVHYPNWPLPKKYAPTEQLPPPSDLIDEINWNSYQLHEREVETKFKALKVHKTQFKTNKKYLSSFIRKNELFGDFKVIITPKSKEKTIQIGKLNRLTSFEERDDIEKRLGLEKHSIMIEDSVLVQSTRIRKGIIRNSRVIFYAFGYKEGIPFPDMPKIRIIVGSKKHRVYDLTKKLSSDLIGIERQKNDKKIKIRIPLNLLNNPDRVFVDVKSKLFARTIDWVPWRIITLQE